MLVHGWPIAEEQAAAASPPGLPTARIRCMSPHSNGQPAFPATATELDAYCKRYVGALTSALPGRLVCVLLGGSWARGEARPPESDVDLVIVIDTIDDEVLEVLARVWREADLGVAEVYGLDEVKMMDRNALEMYTTNAVVLWGHTPFPAPTPADFASDLAAAAESVARYARCAALYPWLTVEERAQDINWGVAKGGCDSRCATSWHSAPGVFHGPRPMSRSSSPGRQRSTFSTAGRP